MQERTVTQRRCSVCLLLWMTKLGEEPLPDSELTVSYRGFCALPFFIELCTGLDLPLPWGVSCVTGSWASFFIVLSRMQLAISQHAILSLICQRLLEDFNRKRWRKSALFYLVSVINLPFSCLSLHWLPSSWTQTGNLLRSCSDAGEMPSCVLLSLTLLSLCFHSDNYHPSLKEIKYAFKTHSNSFLEKSR